MCFNLFGPLKVNYDLAARIFEQLLGSEVEKVLDVRIEYAPEPTCEYLDDRTAFDAFVEFVRSDGTNSFVGIETKLTEPFSQKHYDTPAYRRWSEREYSPWPKKAWPYLADIRHNQLWRDHLLTLAMQHHSQSSYSTGFLMLVRHPADTQCAEAVDVYSKLLKPQDKSFLDYPLDKLVDKIELCLENASAKIWLNEFRKRYLNLTLSEDEWMRRTAG
jgi:hypothetical protein